MKTLKRALSVLLIVCMLLSCVPAVSVAAAGTAGTTAIQDLEVDQRTTPLGIDNTTPEFRWEMVSDVRGQKQTAYQIVVKDGETVVWDSGKVESDVSNAIRYGGSALESATRYTWTVTVWDKDGNALPSQESWFEMGLLKDSDWTGASFIAPSVEDNSVDMTTDQYTIDFDFIINNDNQGFCFNMKDTGSFIVWQVNTYDSLNVNHQGDRVLLRPHFMANNGWKGYPGQPGYNVVAVDITDAVGVTSGSALVGKQVHERIVVSGANIKTYFGPAGTTSDTPSAELTLAYDFTYSGASSLPFNGVGFRHNSDGNAQEVASYDNIVCKDANGNILYANDFSNPDSVGFTGGSVEIVDGWLKVGTLSTTGGEKRIVATAEELGSAAPMFRKEFTVKEGLVSARLYSTCLGIYEAYINGAQVGVDRMAPGWTDYHKYVQYQTHDVTDMLKTGTNAMGAIVGNGWYSGHVSTGGRVNIYGTDEAFLSQLVLTYADGTTETVGTDVTWKSYTDGPFRDTCNQNGETYDATKEIPGWNEAGLNTSDWTGTKIATKQTINTNVDVANIDLVAQPEDPVKVIEELPVKFLAKTGEDTYVYDIGQNIAGVVSIKVTGEAGTTLKLRHGEMVYKDTNALYTANLREAKATDYYTLKGTEGGETYTPTFTFHGFRYFEVSGLGYQPAEEDITALVVHSQLDRTGYVETNNALVNQLFSNITWGQRDNYLSIPTDCPQRDERMGWLGDATTFSRTAAMNFDINAFYTKFIRDVEAARDENSGSIYSIAPKDGHPVGGGASIWGDFAIIGPWTMYTAYGDTAILDESWEMMTDWIGYYQNVKAGSDYIVDNDTYGDWLAISESTPTGYISTAYYAYVTSLMAKMATALGKTDEAAYYTDLFNHIRDAFNAKFVNQTTGKLSADTQTGYCLALCFDLLPDPVVRQKAADHLVSRIQAKDWHLSGGFTGIEYLLPALSQTGYSDVAYQLLLTETYPSWLYSVVNGATTMWERWNSYIAETGTFGDVSMNSFNHYSFGSVAEWMYQYAGGIRYDEAQPGYKHFTLAPNPSKVLNQFKVEYESVYGRIVSDWNVNGDLFTLNATVPANTTATVVIPSDDAAALTVDGKAAAEAVEGVTYVGTEDGYATFEVVSGTYAFTSALKDRVTVTASADSTATGNTLTSFSINGQKGGYATVVEGSEVTVEARAVNAAEWEFVSWSGDAESTENPLTIVANGDLNLAASFRYVGKTNLAEGKTVTASDSLEAGAAWSKNNLVDGVYIANGTKNGYTSSGANSANFPTPIALTVDLGAVNVVNEVHLYPRTDSLTAEGGTASFPADFTIQVSENGSDWTVVVTETGYEAPAVGVPACFTFDNQNARYVKLNATKAGTMPGDDTLYRVQLAELGVYNNTEADEYTLTIDGNGTVLVNGEAVELPYTNVFPANTDVSVEAVDNGTITFDSWSGSVNSNVAKQSLLMNGNKALTAKFVTPAENNLALGKTVSSNTNLVAPPNWGAQLLTDGLLSGTGYSSALTLDKNGPAVCDIWIDIDLQEVKLLDTVVLHPRNTPAETAAGQTPSYPRDFTLQVSDDKANWTVVKAVTDERNPGAGEPMTYELDTPVVGRYVRLHVTKPGLVEDSDLYYRVQLTEEQIFNRRYAESVAFTNDAVVSRGATLETALAATLKNGTVLDLTGKGFQTTYASSNEAVATVDANGVVTGVAAGEAVITANVTINGITYTAEQTVTVKRTIVDVALSVSGAEKITVDSEEVSFTVSAKDTVNLATVTVELALDTKTMADPVVEAADGWYVIAQTYADGKLTAVLGNNAGANSDEAVDILTVTAKTTGKVGNASVAITAARLSAYLEEEGETYVGVILGDDATAVTKVDYSIYDVNKDGVVNQLDLTRAQRWYGTDDATCDVDNSGEVDIADMILILNHYTK